MANQGASQRVQELQERTTCSFESPLCLLQPLERAIKGHRAAPLLAVIHNPPLLPLHTGERPVLQSEILGFQAVPETFQAVQASGMVRSSISALYQANTQNVV